MNTVIRDATEADAGTLLRLVGALAKHENAAQRFTATEALYRASLFGKRPSGYAFIAEQAGRPVGAAVWSYTFDAFSGYPALFLEELFIEPEQRGLGLGLDMLRALVRRAVAEGCSRIGWYVLEGNEPAAGFYRRIGAAERHDLRVFILKGDAFAALAGQQQA